MLAYNDQYTALVKSFVNIWAAGRKHESSCSSIDIIIFLFGYKCVISIFRACSLHVFLCLAPHAKCNLSDSNLFLASFLIISSHIHIFYKYFRGRMSRGNTFPISNVSDTFSAASLLLTEQSESLLCICRHKGSVHSCRHCLYLSDREKKDIPVLDWEWPHNQS